MSFADANYASALCFNHLHPYFTEHANTLLLLIADHAEIWLDIVLFNMPVIGIAVALIFDSSVRLPTYSYIFLVSKSTCRCTSSKMTCQAQKDQQFPPQ